MPASDHYLQPVIDKAGITVFPEFAACLDLSRSAAHRAVAKLEASGELRVFRAAKQAKVASADVLRLLSLTRAEAVEIVREHQAAQADPHAYGTADRVSDGSL